MKTYTDVNGENPISGATLRQIIKYSDFETAWIFVCVYIIKMRLTPLHLGFIKFKCKHLKSSLVLAGRGLGKSFTLNTSFVLTLILRDHNIRIAVVTQTMRQAKRFINDIKGFFEPGKAVYEIFGDLRGNTWNKEEICLKRERTIGANTIIAGSMESPANLISKHFDVLVLDDVVGSDNSRTKNLREKFKETLFSSVLPTLKADGGYGFLNMIGTRYHADDYWQEVIDRGKVPVLIKPALVIDKKSGKERSASEVTRTTQELLDQREIMGSIFFDMQYQQKVRKGTGGIFKPEWMQYFSEYERTPDGVYVHVPQQDGTKRREKVRVYAGVDLAISKKENADSTVMSIIGIDRYNRTFLLDFDRGKYSFHETMEMIKRMASKWNPERIGIEAVAYQKSMYQELKRTSMLPVIEIKATNDKASRMNMFSGQFESGKVFFNEKIRGLDDYETEFYEFKADDSHDHDDCPDSMELAWQTAKKNAPKTSSNLNRSILPF